MQTETSTQHGQCNSQRAYRGMADIGDLRCGEQADGIDGLCKLHRRMAKLNKANAERRAAKNAKVAP